MTDHKPCDPADPCSTAFDLASERNTLDGLWAETKDRLDAALAQVARLRGALEIIVGCFDAAVIEGLYDRMAEQDNQDPGSLHGLIARRILHAEPVARAALAETAATPAPAPSPADDICGYEPSVNGQYRQTGREHRGRRFERTSKHTVGAHHDRD